MGASESKTDGIDVDVDVADAPVDRVPFSNLLDNIGGQELQSSGQFLLCQLRQTSSRDTTAQLFGVARTRRVIPS